MCSLCKVGIKELSSGSERGIDRAHAGARHEVIQMLNSRSGVSYHGSLLTITQHHDEASHKRTHIKIIVGKSLQLICSKSSHHPHHKHATQRLRQLRKASEAGVRAHICSVKFQVNLERILNVELDQPSQVSSSVSKVTACSSHCEQRRRPC